MPGSWLECQDLEDIDERALIGVSICETVVSASRTSPWERMPTALHDELRRATMGHCILQQPHALANDDRFTQAAVSRL